ncbi:putative acyl-CoA dehydrogenase YdbM [Paenibacillus sp. J31TS4]|uniref:acyl-CoA dehydrogenase family protein n=1 Tax=Paenibacillus sp. J31TS4 TaxID=2807195 RepID=UPI001B20C00A|nr:acyl-CoA dehydrogenase family protein [Paenibacillus sp. J31TS4]GIP41250.1 putative acyl-CoA dehydrogenase YdbM [Paenibacillus sp. J31TS4]
MTTTSKSDPFIRNGREERIAALADRLAARFAERAAEHDRVGSFPFENFEEMKQEGYLGLPVPKEYGGDEMSLYELVLAQERLARGDGSTALAVGWHMGIVLNERYAHAWPERLFASFCGDVVNRGAMINSFASERATGSPSRGGRPQTEAVPVEGGWLLTGRKTFSTLSPILQEFIVTAGVTGTEETGEFYVERGEGVRVEETWNTLGMRATGSHDLVLERVFVPEAHVLSITVGGKRPPRKETGDGWLLHIPACYLGIAYAARRHALRFALSYRPNSLPGPIAELPSIRQHIAAMEEEFTVARAYLYAAADRWDREPEARAAMKPELGLAKKLATNAALSVVDKAMRIVGGSSLSRTAPLERLYRDVRAGLHNPPMDDTVMKLLADRALDEAGREDN